MLGGLCSRVDFEHLLYLQNVLDIRLCTYELSLNQYEREWQQLLVTTGYTQAEYELKIDRRWDYLNFLRLVHAAYN